MNRIPGLDLLRAVAIVWVMLFHSYLVGGLGANFDWLSRFGWMGVDMFFVLSGFLIGTQVLRPLSRGDGLSLRAFYARRAWRIVPAFAVVLFLYACFPALREAPGLQPCWQFATFTVNLLIDYSRNQAFSHAWSLCIEEQFYLVFPWLAWLMARRSTARTMTVAVACVVVGGVVLRAFVWLHDAALNPPRNWFIEDIYYPTWMRLDGLLVGVTLAAVLVYRPVWWARLQARASKCLLVGLIGCALSFWLFRDRPGLLANTVGWPVLSFSFGLLVMAGSNPRSVISRWQVPGAAFVATISYSLYLSHKMVFHLIQTWVAPWLSLSGVPLFALYAMATLLAGAMLHLAVERPFLMLRDYRGRSSSSPRGNTTSRSSIPNSAR